MANGKPPCGRLDASRDDDLTTILLVLGILLTLVGGITKAADIAQWLISQGVTLGIPLAAIAGALAAFAVITIMVLNRCNPTPGVAACAAGVINEIVPSFDSGVDSFFTFTAIHDRVDVVVKSSYWHLVANNVLVRCANDPLQSPMLAAFYFSEEVCAAGTGAIIGGAAGIIPGVLAGVALGVLIGCATVILCLIALIVAAIVAAAIVVAAAVIGGQIGKAVGGSSQPSADGADLAVGDYITTTGNLLNVGYLDGARGFWWVTDTTLHGRSTGVPPFSYTDPDTNLNPDACPVIIE